MTEKKPVISDFMKSLRDEYGFDTIAVRQLLLEELPAAPEGTLLLDVGTGSGWMAISAAQRGYMVISIDPDIQGLGRAQDRAHQVLQQNCNRIKFLNADASHMPFQDNAFPAVISFDVVHHFSNSICPAAIQEMIRVCKHGGDITIGDLNTRGRDVVRALHARAGLAHDENRCGVREIESLIHQNGLRATRKETRFVTIFHTLK